MEKNYKRIAFVVATKDRPKDIRSMLRSLAEQGLLPDQIVIVDSSAEPVRGVIPEFLSLNIKYIHHGRPSASAQRNIGILAVDPGIELIGFLDDDVVLEPSAIEAMLKFWHEAPEDIGGCAFNLKNFESSNNEVLKYSSLAQWLGLYSKEKGVVTESGWQTMTGIVKENTFVQYFPSTAAVWKREVFEEFSFDEYFDGYSYLEDLDFSISVNKKYKLAVIADAGVCHYPSPYARVSSYIFGKIEVRNRIYIVRKHHLSLLKCYIGLIIRLFMTLRLAVKDRKLGYFQRAFGNCAGLVKFFVT